MHNPTEVLALIIAEKQEEINKLKAALKDSEATEARNWRWYQEEEAKVNELTKKVKALEEQSLGNFIKLHKDA